MPTIPYNSRFAITATMELDGKCHAVKIGDSQSTKVLNYLWCDTWPQELNVRPHYVCASGQNTGQVDTNNFGYAIGNGANTDTALSRDATSYSHQATITSNSAANPTVVTTSGNHGLVTGNTVAIAGQVGGVSINGSHVVTVTGATTFTVAVDCTSNAGTGGTATISHSSRVMHGVRTSRFTADIAADTLNTSSGLILSRQTSPASNANSSRQAPLPTFPTNGGQPWFHGTRVKAKMVLWKDSSTLDKFAIYLLRQGTSANNSNLGTRTQVDVSGASTGPVGTGWTDVLVDAGTYDVAALGINNDHECAIRMYSSSAVYDESSRLLIPLCGIFARCDAAGAIPWNSDNSGFGYDALGRSGAYVSDWLNYCTQADWQAYFSATVLVPNQVCKITIMLGHNCSPTTIDVGDGDGAQAEQAANVTTTYWKKRYKVLISRLRAAYIAAFPAGRIEFELIVPWVSVQNSSMSNTTLAADINSKIKEVADEEGCAYFSFYEYWNAQPPFYNLHAWTPGNGKMLARALRDGMDRATNFAHSTLGSMNGEGMRNRSFR